MRGLNYNHLYYFWVVAKEGSLARGAERLHLSPQTVSAQLRTLEEALGAALFTLSGHRLALTDTGRLALSYADEIFHLGSELREAMHNRQRPTALRLSVGVVDALPKLVAYRLLEAALRLPEPVRLACREGGFDALLADMAVHRLDLMLADRPVAAEAHVRLYSHPLGECGISFFAAPALARDRAAEFPRCLDGAPFLLPTPSIALRGRLERWFEETRVAPRIVGEFDDSALLKTFGRAGAGIFAAPSAITIEIEHHYGVKVLGRTEAVREQYFAISPERRLKHPAVAAICSLARRQVFGDLDA